MKLSFALALSLLDELTSRLDPFMKVKMVLIYE